MSMSSSKDHNNDDYVAKLLAEEAKRSSQRYASAGLQALLPKRYVDSLCDARHLLILLQCDEWCS